MNILYTLNVILYFYGFIIIFRVFLTWIPNLDWETQPLKALSSITDPYISLFRNLIPPIAGLDFSAVIALIVLQIVQTVINRVLI